MTYQLDTENGPVDAPVSLVNGRLLFCTRAASREVWDAVARSVKLIDEDGNPLGATIAHIGPVVLSWTEGEDGPVPDQVDTRHHANVLLDAETTAKGLWKNWALAWMDGDDIVPNAAEVGKAKDGIDLIDPDTIRSPVNRIG